MLFDETPAGKATLTFQCNVFYSDLGPTRLERPFTGCAAIFVIEHERRGKALKGE